MHREERERPAIVGILLRILILLIVLLILAVGAFLAYIYTNDYQPEPLERLSLSGRPAYGEAQLDRTYSILTYNIGYCGLGAEQDFFMEGGDSSGAFTEEEVLRNLSAVDTVLDAGYDFMLLQEVDAEGKRSFDIDQRTHFEERFKENYMSTFAVNYDVAFVPIPITNPMGHALSGLLTLSAVQTESAARHQLAGEENPVMQLFELDRCYTVINIPVEDGKTLYLINTHFSAYDSGGTVKARQMEQMKAFLEEHKDDYVILGGDWNQVLPGAFEKPSWWKKELPDWVAQIPKGFVPAGFQWGADAKIPTCRANDKPYKEGENFVTGIDGFLVSPNIEILSTEALDLNFQNTDHNPVKMEFILKP